MAHTLAESERIIAGKLTLEKVSEQMCAAHMKREQERWDAFFERADKVGVPANIMDDHANGPSQERNPGEGDD